MDACILCHCVLIKAYRHVFPSLSWPYLSLLLPYPLLYVCFPSLLRSTFPADIYLLSYILFSLLMFCSCYSFLPSFISYSLNLHLLEPPSIHCPKVISTGRPSMRTQCWRLRGAGSWNSSSLSSLSPKASSHPKVSATSEVRSQAPTKGVISFLSIHVSDWVICIYLCVRVCEIVSLWQLLLQYYLVLLLLYDLLSALP